jgi:hypothetical protein
VNIRKPRVTFPPPDDGWDVGFTSSEAVQGWEELCRLALANAHPCLEALMTRVFGLSAHISRLLRSAVQRGFAGSDGHAVGDDLTGF